MVTGIVLLMAQATKNIANNLSGTIDTLANGQTEISFPIWELTQKGGWIMLVLAIL